MAYFVNKSRETGEMRDGSLMEFNEDGGTAD